MRRIAVLAGACVALAFALLAPAGASAAFTQCPPVELDSGCQFLVTVSDTETTVESNPALGAFDPGGDDTLIGIQNNSSKPLASIPFSAEIELFGFEADGICQMTKPAPGCKVLARSSTGAPNPEAGTACPPATTACGFEPEGEEPAGLKFPEGVTVVGRLKNEDPVSGYEGPTSYFTNIGRFGSFATGSGVVNFTPPIPPGGHSYFSLESPPTGGFGSSGTLTTTLSGGGQAGASISVVQGTSVTDTATLGGAGAPAATGPVSFNVYSDPECKTLVIGAGTAKLAGGTAGPSAAVSSLAPGRYYWQARYAGSLAAQAVTSSCGSEILTVLAATSTSTLQTGGGVIGASIPVLVGSSVKDQARVAGPLAATATGTVTYTLYRDNRCSLALAPSSVGVLLAGTATPSAAIKPKAGTYYWVASYSGDAANAPSVSACGSEVLIVSAHASLNLPKVKGCVSRRRFVVHPRAPRNLKLVRVQVYINGKLVKEGRLRRGGTTLSLVGLPKGTFRVAFVTYTARGASYEDTRTFHTCVPKRHKKK